MRDLRLSTESREVNEWGDSQVYLIRYLTYLVVEVTRPVPVRYLSRRLASASAQCLQPRPRLHDEAQFERFDGPASSCPPNSVKPSRGLALSTPSLSCSCLSTYVYCCCASPGSVRDGRRHRLRITDQGRRKSAVMTLPDLPTPRTKTTASYSVSLNVSELI